MKTNILISCVTEFDVTDLANAVEFFNAIPDKKTIDDVDYKQVSKRLMCNPKQPDKYAVVVDYTNGPE